MKRLKLSALILAIAIAVFVLTACPARSAITVTFMLDGVVYKTVEVKPGAAMPDDPKQDFLTFGGWFKDDNTFADEFKAADLANVTVDLTVYAKRTFTETVINENMTIERLIVHLEGLISASTIEPGHKSELLRIAETTREDAAKLPTYRAKLDRVHKGIQDVRQKLLGYGYPAALALADQLPIS